MRRGIGAAHLQQEQRRQQKMAELGAQMSAQRVAQIHEQLETLEGKLRVLARDHADEIKKDPVVRARFRQLADSLGIDLISSKCNTFAGILGLGDFYYALSGKVVEACMKERRFCGSYVPLSRVIDVVQKSYDSAVTATKKTVIAEEDILQALRKLRCFGAGYTVVELRGIRYIQTTPDGAAAGDEVALLNHVLNEQRTRMQAARRRAATGTTTSSRRASGGAGPAVVPPRPTLGVAAVLRAHPLAEPAAKDSTMDAEVSLEAQCVALTAPALGASLGWPAHRIRAALQRMVQEGTVWVEHPAPRTAVEEAKPRGSLMAKEVWRATAKAAPPAAEDGTVYWFVSLTTHATEDPTPAAATTAL